MRHSFDIRQCGSIGTFTSDKLARKQPSVLGRSGVGNTPPISSVPVEHLEDKQSGSACEPVMLGKILPEARFFGCTDLPLASFSAEVALCEPGELVLYRIGEGDPNEFIAQVLARGAAGIVTEQLLPCPLPQCIVGSVDHALAKIASSSNHEPDRKLLTVGVLGQSGKTSTCLLTATMTKALGIRTAYQCDLGSSDGVVSETPSRQVPVGADLINWLGLASDCVSRVAVIEIDEAAAREGHFDALQFDVLIVAGKCQPADDFGPCGLNCLLDRLTSTGVVIVPDNDAKAIRMLEEADCHHLSYGTSADSEFGAIVVDQSGGMSTLMLSAGDTSVMVETPLCGLGMASNLAATAAMGVLLGHSLNDVAKHLVTLRSIPGRGQRLVEFGQATVVIETGGSIDRVAESLRTAKAAGAGGRVWCVLAVGENDCEDTLASFGQIIERYAHHCVVTSQPNQSGSFLKRSHQVLDGVKECAAIRLVADQQKAIQWAMETARPRDTVVWVTNRRDQTAFDARSEIDAFAAFVESTRSQIADSNSSVSEVSEAGTPITLKLFP